MENPGLNCSNRENVTFQVRDIFIHPDFNFPYFDIAIIKLTSYIEFTKGITSVCLSRALSDDLTGNAVSLFGWGAIKKDGTPSKFLRGTRQLIVTSVRNCLNKIGIFTYEDPLYASVFNRTSWLITKKSDGKKSMEALICIEDQDPYGLTGSCAGDSGGPVVQWAFTPHGGRKYEQVGIVSGGRCSDSGTPSVLTHIGHKKVLEFIHNVSKFPILICKTSRKIM